MNHRMCRTLAAGMLLFTALVLCSGCSPIISAFHGSQALKHLAAGEYEAAIAEATKAIELTPYTYPPYVWRGENYSLSHMTLHLK